MGVVIDISKILAERAASRQKAKALQRFFQPFFGNETLDSLKHKVKKYSSPPVRKVEHTEKQKTVKKIVRPYTPVEKAILAGSGTVLAGTIVYHNFLRPKTKPIPYSHRYGPPPSSEPYETPKHKLYFYQPPQDPPTARGILKYQKENPELFNRLFEERYGDDKPTKGRKRIAPGIKI